MGNISSAKTLSIGQEKMFHFVFLLLFLASWIDSKPPIQAVKELKDINNNSNEHHGDGKQVVVVSGADSGHNVDDHDDVDDDDDYLHVEILRDLGNFFKRGKICSNNL